MTERDADKLAREILWTTPANSMPPGKELAEKLTLSRAVLERGEKIKALEAELTLLKMELCGERNALTDLYNKLFPNEPEAEREVRWKHVLLEVDNLITEKENLIQVIDHLLGKPWDTGCIWVCEVHPNKIFPHDDCPGPGMPPYSIFFVRDKTLQARIDTLEAENAMLKEQIVNIPICEAKGEEVKIVIEEK